MAAIPKRSLIATPYRFVLNKLEPSLPLPVKNPDFYTVLAVVLSVLFFFIQAIVAKLVLLAAILILDWLDGAAARKYKGVSKQGYIVDVVFDRFSDGIIIASALGTTIGKILFGLYLVNNVLSYVANKTGKHYLIAVRFFYFLVLLFELFNPLSS